MKENKKILDSIRPVWAEIDLNCLENNIKEARRLTGEKVQICAALKANAYGHGAVKAAKVFLENGIERFSVAILDEAIELRKAGIEAPILILGYTEPKQSDRVAIYDITQTIFSFDAAKALSDASLKLNKKSKIHIKIDTGMGRLGFNCQSNQEDPIAMEKIIDEIKIIDALPGIDVEGIFTHFSTADEPDKSYTMMQFRLFQELIRNLEQQGIIIPMKHCANSAAVYDFPETHLDMVRPGILLYCMPKLPGEHRIQIHPKQVMNLKTRIIQVKELREGDSVGYGRSFIAEKSVKIATLPIGYEDGYNRQLSNGRGEVLIKGKRAPITGRICMDQCMVDITGIDDVCVGDEAVLFGAQGEDFISVDEIADKLNTISYEVICSISVRVPRVYYKNGKIIDYTNYLLSR